MDTAKKNSVQKRPSKKYKGTRRKHIMRDERYNGSKNDTIGGGLSGIGTSLGGTSGSVGPTIEELDSDYDKPYDYESEAFNSPVSSEDEGRTAYDAFNEETEYGEVEFKVGQTFTTMEAFKSALKDYFVYEGKDVMYLKNEKQRVKTLFNEHNCGRNFSSNLADRQWVTSKLVKRLLTQPDMKPKQAMEYMIEDYNIQLSGKMISRALKAAREEVIGDEGAQYGKIRDYLMELHRTNPGSTARLDVIPQPKSLPLFDRLYISLDACKKGFIEGCRPLIGLDGCFLKGYYGGQLLSAVGQDGNNHFFVIAYAVVPNECKDTWKWFLTQLQHDLALKDIFPRAFHRNCVLHIWKNFIKQFKDQQTKQLVWDCARCTTQIEFKAAMEKLKQISVPAWEYLDRFDPAAWSKAFFSPGPKVDNITNNMCEVWNAKILHTGVSQY
ncbi:uncharacterized protein [Arachis hypogaea]|uniref:uncharacterized protein n=1 Tax=Arachis hypogaea TaxID=3818 RepID=UPI000DED14AF|nr:uncharacterized protein LOC112709464 [Arachis hypogaea]